MQARLHNLPIVVNGNQFNGFAFLVICLNTMIMMMIMMMMIIDIDPV